MRCCAGLKGRRVTRMSTKARPVCPIPPGETRYGGQGDASQREAERVGQMGTESKGREANGSKGRTRAAADVHEKLCLLRVGEARCLKGVDEGA